MVHMTKKNTARFDFDLRFPKMPSYLRRSAIQHALGSVSSYETRLGQWKETGVLSGRPKLTCRNHAMPVFYRDVMYREGAEGKDEAYLKLYDGHDWKWFRVYLKRTDMEYLRRNWKGKKTSAPALEKRHRRYFLRFSCTEEVTLMKTPVKEQIICSVDLGINTDAVCTIMRSDGTVGVGRAVSDAGAKDKIAVVGVDCSQEAINLMEMGVYKGIIVQKAFRMGYIGVEETIHMLNGDAVEKNIDSGCELVTPENMYNSDIERLIFPFS